MEIAISIGIGIIFAILLGKDKKHEKKSTPYNQSNANTPRETVEERKRRETDELITVIIPTINNDK